MASRAKPTGTTGRRTGTRAKKPATIDLQAKEVAAKTAASDTAKSEPPKTETATKTAASAKSETAAKPTDTKKDTVSQPFGRDAAKSKTTAPNSPKNSKVEEKPKLAANPEKQGAPKAKGGFGGAFAGGVVGAALMAGGLGVIGQFSGSDKLPLIGSLYANGDSDIQTSANGDAIAGLNARLEELAASIPTAGEGQLSSDIAVQINALEAKTDELSFTLETMVSSLADEGPASDVELTASIAALSSRLEAMEQAGGTTAASSDMQSQISNMEAAIAQLQSAAEIDFSPVQAQIDEVRQSVAALKELADSNASGVGALGAQFNDVQDTVASVKASEKVARSVAVNALGTALENDDALTLPISSIKALLGETPEIAQLEALSTSGIPTRASLVAQLDAFINKVQNPAPDTQGMSFSEKLLSNVAGLVEFRSSGPREGTDSLAILSRVRDQLIKSNYDAVASEWQILPQEVQDNGSDWYSKFAIRQEVQQLQRGLVSVLNTQSG